MENYIHLSRFVHIFAGIFWVGTTLFMILFLEPTIEALGPHGSKFMQKLIGGTRFSLAMALAGWLTIASGVLMYWPITGGLDAALMFTIRLPLTLGALCGILAGIVGTGVQGRASGQLMALGREIAAQEVPPTPIQLSAMSALQTRIRLGSRLTAILMVMAVIGMVW